MSARKSRKTKSGRNENRCITDDVRTMWRQLDWAKALLMSTLNHDDDGSATYFYEFAYGDLAKHVNLVARRLEQLRPEGDAPLASRQ